jgi:ubiquinone/menaquinone biosynthesis C-methylase UbiE
MSYTHSLSEARAENHASLLTAVIQNRTANAEFGLDVGSGEGKIANKLREKSGIIFIGLEPHLPTSQIIIGNVTVMQGFADKIPFDNKTFDVVVTLISV